MNLPRLGAQPPLYDPRNFKVGALLNYDALPSLPNGFLVDSTLPVSIPDAPDGNWYHGDCVIAARAKATRRFEAYEQGVALNITEAEILYEYFKESGGADNGLSSQGSLDEWRQQGWTTGGKTYNIDAYAQVNLKNHLQVQYSIYLFKGVIATLALPITAQNQSAIWQIPQNLTSNDAPGSWGYHEVYIPQWLPNCGYPICLTWGGQREMTWDWWDKYVMETFAVIDNKDAWVTNSPVNPKALEALLAEVTHVSPNKKQYFMNHTFPGIVTVK